MSSEPSWDLYRTFAAVLREGSLSGAARSLGLTQPSVARHIEALERAIGGTLFVRSPRGLSPTDRAAALRPFAEELAATSAALRRTASAPAHAIAGTVRVTASEIVAIEHLPPLLATLRQRHPALAVELVASDAVDDLLQRRADIAIRMVQPAQQALVARRVGSVTLGLHAHRDYLAKRGSPPSLAELRTHDLIGVDSDSATARAVLAALPGFTLGDFALRTDSAIGQLAAIRAGCGIGICQVEIARRDAALVRILPESLAMVLPLWVVMHEDLRTSVRCRAVFDHLAEALATEFGGTRGC